MRLSSGQRLHIGLPILGVAVKSRNGENRYNAENKDELERWTFDPTLIRPTYI